MPMPPMEEDEEEETSELEAITLVPDLLRLGERARAPLRPALPRFPLINPVITCVELCQ